MRIIVFVIATTAIASCLHRAETGPVNDVDPQRLYYDYKVWGDEASDEVTVMLQYRYDGEDGTSLMVDSAASVFIDGVGIQVDSAKGTGAFYELVKPAADFIGNHNILFTDKNGKEHKEEFQYNPLSLATELPEKINRQPMTIKLTGFDKRPTTVRLVMTDTAFGTRDINEDVRIEHGEILIDSARLSNLKNGPINLEIYREEVQELKNGTEQGGRLQINYSLKRRFDLVN